jgi:abhydrolase domain-containing protein 12
MSPYNQFSKAPAYSPENQIRPLNITTLDGEVLYAWHVLPLDVYRQYEKELIAEPKGLANYKDSVAYRAVTKDPDSKVVVNCTDQPR